ncbi:PREDICTED: inactive RESTRICTED TEV [Prunus dulcis]|uniref:PREDICTED: inactive RESTRICTED TEV n=1 Tax=Prunus dulcis TaxID=3755 RepID=A0A5E4EMY2_PRUDU|nr:inactive protein RESTRICTED TEV MOVEMENT 2-like [Prunus dulcis]VVA17054.1 PREDICTED: inactive RESTRICTED TEV [Prunus dulcis]
MAQVRGSSTRGMGERSSSSTRLHQKILPSSGWTEDSNGHYLLVDLPDFKKEEVKLVVNVSAGHLTVSGQRQVNEKKSEYFEQNFTIPPNSDVDKITGKFDGEILYVTVPKVAAVVEEKKEAEPEIENQNVDETAATEPAKPENKNVEGAAAENIHLTRPKNDGQHSNKDDGASKKLSGINDRIFFSLENIRKWDKHEDGILKTAMEMLSKNKGTVITAVVAFSLGVLVSRQTFQ